MESPFLRPWISSVVLFYPLNKHSSTQTLDSPIKNVIKAKHVLTFHISLNLIEFICSKRTAIWWLWSLLIFTYLVLPLKLVWLRQTQEYKCSLHMSWCNYSNGAVTTWDRLFSDLDVEHGNKDRLFIFQTLSIPFSWTGVSKKFCWFHDFFKIS